MRYCANVFGETGAHVSEYVAVAVRDSKSELFTTPMFFATRGVAVRSFQAAVNDPQSAFFKNPEDYGMYVVGKYDDASGVFVPAGPEVLTLAVSLLTGGRV